MGVRQMIERDLAVTLEGDYGVACTLVGPDGTVYTTNTLGKPITGRLVYDHAEIGPNGETVVVHSPCLTLRTSTLPRVPKHDERWMVKAPKSMIDPTPTLFFLDADRPPEDGGSIGFKRLYLMAGAQS